MLKDFTENILRDGFFRRKVIWLITEQIGGSGAVPMPSAKGRALAFSLGFQWLAAWLLLILLSSSPCFTPMQTQPAPQLGGPHLDGPHPDGAGAAPLNQPANGPYTIGMSTKP